VDGNYSGQTTTDATGTYAFSRLPTGTYKIVVTLNGYETATYSGGTITGGTSKSLMVK
jgi:hypothetical protein